MSAAQRETQNPPTPRHFVTALISGLHNQSETSGADLADSKQSLLTLHVLFQNELLPALDLLDRGLVTQLRCHSPSQALNQARENLPAVDEETAKTFQGSGTYYVLSGQAQASRTSNSRFRNATYEHTTYYEVHLSAWSCSCPAFAFSAFPASRLDTHQTTPFDQPHVSNDTTSWTFGGLLTLGTDMPICKHLLACVLVEHSSTFSHMVEEREVSVEEMAGWAAGWGD